ncbi:hypothetical protein ACFV29_04035 [Streptomyces sp. NPDC059690]|uniref:hypothetical protein n=1 Tax=Streptomyces sp. NPDC059690 TaxID=3346907 RepID=UPI0036B969DC
MSLTFNLEVRWPNGRQVRVRCRGIPLVSVLADEPGDKASAMDDQDVVSLAALNEYLKKVTRLAPNAGAVDVIGFEPTLFKLLELLNIEGPPPDSITIELV